MTEGGRRPNTTIVRGAVPTDQEALLRLERDHFPPISGHAHSGYVFEGAGAAALIVAPEAKTHWLIAVAEVDGEIVGFGLAASFPMPGSGERDRQNMLLLHLAVEASHRRRGLGRDLVRQLEARARGLGQHVMVAHIPGASASFYSSIGWQVGQAGAGFAWIPRASYLRADLPDPELGYPHMASIRLTPTAVLADFEFPRVEGRPILDACHVLRRLLNQGKLNEAQLHSDTRAMLGILEYRHPPRGTFGQRTT